MLVVEAHRRHLDAQVRGAGGGCGAVEGVNRVGDEGSERFAALLRFFQRTAVGRFACTQEAAGGGETTPQVSFGRGGAVLHGGILAQADRGG
jgi:hypothetical protein